MAEDTKDDGPDYAEENALRNASESLHNYDPAADTFTAVFGAPVPAATIYDEEREILVRVEPQSRAVVGFTIPNFKAWYAKNYPEGGEWELDLPPTWPMGGDESPAQ